MIQRVIEEGIERGKGKEIDIIREAIREDEGRKLII